MKSLVNSLSDIAYGIIKDIRMAYPRLRGLDLDCERLSRNCQSRGKGLFTLDLPSLDSLLVKGLEVGRLELSGPLSCAVSQSIRVPRLFSGLWLRVFDNNACLRPDADVNSILFLRQLFCLGKRIEVQCSHKRLLKAVRGYHAIEHELRPPSLKWDNDGLDPESRLNDLHLLDAVRYDGPLFEGQNRPTERGMQDTLRRCQQVADLVSAELGFFESTTYSGELHDSNSRTGFRHGPGAVADRRGYVNKYEFPRWSAKLEEWFPYRLCGTIASDTESTPLNHEVSSRLIAVPKTAKSPRLIASEPTEHQWCQQAIRHFMVSKMKAIFGQHFVCFEKQELSGEMALQASLDQSLATIDLSDASDRLSCFVVERLLRRNPSLLHSLHAARTRYIRDEISPNKSFIKLKKFASQGTATTFPVQTLAFLIIALGVSIKGKVSWAAIRRLRGQVRVFGDDIILPNTRYAEMTDVLHFLGLKVNVNKSFHVGFFRESCGVDAYKGYDVTPTKPLTVIPDGPASRQAVLDTSNNLYQKGYWNASSVCESTLGDRLLRRLPIVGRDSGLTGRVSFSGTDSRHLRRRWCYKLQRYEYQVWSVSTAHRRISFGERFALLQYFTEAPAQGCSRILPGANQYESGLAKRPQLREKLRWDPLLSQSPELRRS